MSPIGRFRFPRETGRAPPFLPSAIEQGQARHLRSLASDINSLEVLTL